MDELIVGGQHGEARDAEFNGERPGGWQPLPGPKAALEDGLLETFVKLAVERAGVTAIDREMKSGHVERERNGAGERTACSLWWPYDQEDVNVDQTAKPPVVMGQPLEPHRGLQIWYLHVWVWTENPSALFAD